MCLVPMSGATRIGELNAILAVPSSWQVRTVVLFLPALYRSPAGDSYRRDRTRLFYLCSRRGLLALVYRL